VSALDAHDGANANTVGTDRYWIVVAVRAVAALVVGFAVTFSSDHSSSVGHAAFGALVLTTGVVVGIGAVTTQTGVERALFLANGGVGVSIGLASLLSPASDAHLLPLLIPAWAVVTGFIELYLGVRARRRDASSRDWIFAGGLTVLLAVAVLLVPGDLSQTFTGPDHVTRVLTSAIVTVGIVGAYAAVLGVFLAIAALSLRWSRSDTTQGVRA
jgi:uncharacterized membrane protein HdeD (DUF308 family)